LTRISKSLLGELQEREKMLWGGGGGKMSKGQEYPIKRDKIRAGVWATPLGHGTEGKHPGGTILSC